jgi:hypothetical protein
VEVGPWHEAIGTIANSSDMRESQHCSAANVAPAWIRGTPTSESGSARALLDSCETLAYVKASGHRAQSSRSSKRQGRWTPSQHHRQARQKAQELYDERRFTMAQVAVVVGVSRASADRCLQTEWHPR